MPKAAKSCQKLQKVAKVAIRFPKVYSFPKIFKSGPNLREFTTICQKWPQVAQDFQQLPKGCQKFPKLAKSSQTLAPLDSTWLQLAQFGSTWLHLAPLGSTWLHLASVGPHLAPLGQAGSVCLRLATHQTVKNTQGYKWMDWMGWDGITEPPHH